MIYLKQTDEWYPLVVDDREDGIRQFTFRIHDHGEFKWKFDYSRVKLNYIEKNLYNYRYNKSGKGTYWLHWYGLSHWHSQITKKFPLSSLIRFANNASLSKNEVEATINVIKHCNKKSDEFWYFETGSIAGIFVSSSDYRGEEEWGFENYDKSALCFDIRPRFGEQWLLHMLGKAFRSIDSSAFLARTRQDPSGSLLFLALIWKSAFDKAFMSGLPRIYQHQENSLPSLRGRIDFQKHLRNHFSGRDLHLIPCKYRELTFNNPINRMIRWGYRIIRNILREYAGHLLSNLAQADVLLASYGVPCVSVHISDLDRIHYTAMAENYRPLMQISKALLAGTPEALGGAQKMGQSFLYDITELWEYYLIAVLEEQLGLEGFSVKSANDDEQEKEALLESDKELLFNLKPDILVYKDIDENPIAVLDAKYKRIHNYDAGRAEHPYGIIRDDIYQLLAYRTRYFSADSKAPAILIYPFESIISEGDALEDWPISWHGERQWILKLGKKDSQTDWKIDTMVFCLPILFDKFGNSEFHGDKKKNATCNWFLHPTEDNIYLHIIYYDEEQIFNTMEFQNMPEKLKKILQDVLKGNDPDQSILISDHLSIIENAEKNFISRLRSKLNY